MLDKRLDIGGLQVGGPRTKQNTARFRVANNVYQTNDDIMVPRVHSLQTLSGFSGSPPRIVSTHKYKNAPFIFGMDSSRRLIPYNNAVAKVPCATMPIVTGSGNALGSRGIQSVEKVGNLYANIPEAGLFKYDGVQFYKAGVPLPYVGCPQATSAGATFIRIIQHHLDFQGNTINSGYVQFPVTPVSNVITLRTDKGATDVINSFVGASPSSRPTGEILDRTFNTFFFRASSAVKGASTVTYTTGGDHYVVDGCYILFDFQAASTITTGLPESCLAWAAKVVSSTATTVTVSVNDIKYLNMEREWKTANSPIASLIWNPTTYACTNIYQSVYTSNVATAAYVYKTMMPVFYESSNSFSNSTINVSAPTSPGDPGTICFVLAPIMGDFYDVTTVKATFKNLAAFPSENNSFTTFSNLALISYSNEIYFSDTTLGGAFEMVNGLSFIVIGEQDDGDVQAICGNSDFLLVSRQFKNYYVAGNIVTANYRGQEVGQTPLGAYSNESAYAYSDKIVFFNKTGIYALYSGARCETVSANIKGLFENYAATTIYPEDLYFDISTFPTHASISSTTDHWLRVRSDLNRGLLAFVTKGDGQGKILILNMNNGEFYTWSGILEGYGTAPFDLKDLVFIDGRYYVTCNAATGFAAINTESTALTPYAYFSSDYAPVLETTWFTGGEPSLEKKINQFKLWGKIEGAIEFGYYKDWNTSELTPADSYIGSNPNLFSHKLRLPSANVQSLSVRMKLNTSKFEIEGAEIEFQPLQMGMKR